LKGGLGLASGDFNLDRLHCQLGNILGQVRDWKLGPGELGLVGLEDGIGLLVKVAEGERG
jgi:hypothetical protein